MRVFQRKHSLLGGMDEAIAILKLCSDDWDALTVHALYDGRRGLAVGDGHDHRGRLHALRPSRDVLPRRLARRDLITTNVRRVVEAARGKLRSSSCPRARSSPCPDGRRIRRRMSPARRSDSDRRHHRCAGVVVGRPGIGTVPHALIAAYGGNTVPAATKFAEWAPRRPERRRPRRLRERPVRTSSRSRARSAPASRRRWHPLDRLVDAALERARRVRLRGGTPSSLVRCRGTRSTSTASSVNIVAAGGFDADSGSPPSGDGVLWIPRRRWLGLPARGGTTTWATSSSPTASLREGRPASSPPRLELVT